ncbi:hypothetical protein O181_096487 [Austropuccinia psidii MF-1]|uniref:Uncharacterized protein n=1 Tax=Austropuccinia psidii MF-1 TaxID=1389203 RepID=A0A9Q3J7C8_9BASI|nr:hypothetical protein [Austropuccinia psidii MF-1]
MVQRSDRSPWQEKLAIVEESNYPKLQQWKIANIGKFTPYRSSSFKEPFRVELKNKPKERVAEVAKKKNSRHNCGSTDNYANNCPKAKKNVYAIEKVPEKETPTEDSHSDSMRDATREQSDDEKDPKEESLVEY